MKLAKKEIGVRCLPSWIAPKNLEQAKFEICDWGRNMHEHAYLVGRHLLWVKTKIGHGNFYFWIENNLWFKKRTAIHMMRFAQNCIEQQSLTEYHGWRTKSVPGTLLPVEKAEKELRLSLIGPSPSSVIAGAVQLTLQKLFPRLSEGDQQYIVQFLRAEADNWEKRIGKIHG